VEAAVITELRRYRIVPERLDSWLAFFATAVREHERRGMRVEYVGVDRHTSTMVWMRSFVDEADRMATKDAFYGSEWWREREAFAMSHVLEYDVTFLDAVTVREGGELVDVSPPAAGSEPAGARADTPPDGWITSPQRTFAPR
jgi:hypothetical protein